MSQDEAQGDKPGEQAPPEGGADAEAAAARAAEPDVDLRRKRPRPVLGPAFTLLAALLWAFVVIGTFTTSWLSGGAPLAEGVAIVLVAMATAGAWTHAVRQSRTVPAQGLGGLLRRSVVVGALAFGMWGLLVTFATLAGKASSANIDGYVTTCLLVVVAIAAVAGRRFTMPVRPARTPARSVALAAFWIGVALVTLGAYVEIVAEG
jgi:hypothetical protein